VRLAKRHGVALRHSYARVGKFALIRYQRYAHAKQFKRANRALKTPRTYLGRVIHDLPGKIEDNARLEQVVLKDILSRARRARPAAASARTQGGAEASAGGQGPRSCPVAEPNASKKHVTAEESHEPTPPYQKSSCQSSHNITIMANARISMCCRSYTRELPHV
jgi:hypothetical protein